jgi:hypothetical protein
MSNSVATPLSRWRSSASTSLPSSATSRANNKRVKNASAEEQPSSSATTPANQNEDKSKGTPIMASSDSGVESNADAETLKEEQRNAAQSAPTESRNATVVSPSESSTSDVSGNLRRREEAHKNTSNENDPEQEDEMEEDIVEDEEGDVEDDVEEIEEAESGEHDEEEYRHNSSVGEESSASFGRDGQSVDSIVCGACRRQFPLNQFGNFIEHKVSSGCRNNTKRGSSDESATEFFSPAAYQRRRPRTLAGSKTKRSMSASVGREVATETEVLGEFLECFCYVVLALIFCPKFKSR